jgi:divalent metal cation (Fe/Co/Zn/Cd) transporter
VSLVSPSARVVYAALDGNLAVAAAKFGASALSGSSAMRTEAIHSLVDSADQILLLAGSAHRRLRASASLLDQTQAGSQSA